MTPLHRLHGLVFLFLPPLLRPQAPPCRRGVCHVHHLTDRGTEGGGMEGVTWASAREPAPPDPGPRAPPASPRSSRR